MTLYEFSAKFSQSNFLYIQIHTAHVKGKPKIDLFRFEGFFAEIKFQLTCLA